MLFLEMFREELRYLVSNSSCRQWESLAEVCCPLHYLSAESPTTTLWVVN